MRRKLSLNEKLNAHWSKAEEARNLKDDIIRSKNQTELEVLTFDLEKTLLLPRLATNIIFYKRLYNCGIHNGKKIKDTAFYEWRAQLEEVRKKLVPVLEHSVKPVYQNTLRS